MVKDDLKTCVVELLIPEPAV